MDLTLKDAVTLSLESGNFPETIPADYGLDLMLKSKPNYKVVANNPRTLRIEISTFRGVSAGAIHYYATIVADGVNIIEETDDSIITHAGYICEEYSEICKKERGKYDSVYKIEVMRILTQEEIDSDPIRWNGYHAGGYTNAFYTKIEALEQAIKIAKLRFDKGWLLKLDERIML